MGNKLKLTEAEILFLNYQLDMTGGFYTKLISAILSADQQNMAKIKLAYPDLVKVVHKYRNDATYANDLTRRWNESYKGHKI